jgi:hypothetical protein
MFGLSKATTPQPASPLAATWAAIIAAQNDLEGDRKAMEAEVDDMSTGLQSKLEGLKKVHALLSDLRKSSVDAYNSKRTAGTMSASEEEAFWSALALHDEELQKASNQLDETQLRLYFPAAKGFLWRLAVPGLFAACKGFWIERFTVRSISLDVVPGRGSAWETNGTAPTCTFAASGLCLSLHVSELSMRGDQVPSTLRNVRQLELVIEADLVAPLAFEPPRAVAAKDGGAARRGPPPSSGVAATASAAATRSAAQQQPDIGVNKLLGFRWRVLDSFKFEVCTRFARFLLCDASPLYAS